MIDHSKPNTLLVEKYRPTTLDEYLATDEFKAMIQKFIDDGDIPHLLLHGDAGIGKTTLAKLLVKNIDCDVMYINASDENGIDVIRDKIKSFASTLGMHDMKVIILDEADGISSSGQQALRNVMEEFSRYTRFILTCNYIERVIDPIQSRCQVFSINPPPMKSVGERIFSILDTEGITYAPQDVATIVKKAYPDIRRVINQIQRCVRNGTLVLDTSSMVDATYLPQILEVLLSVHAKKTKKETAFTAIRSIIADANLKDFTKLYTYIYEHIEELDSSNADNRSLMYLAVADASYKDASRVDKEIGVMAMFIEILDILAP